MDIQPVEPNLKLKEKNNKDFKGGKGGSRVHHNSARLAKTSYVVRRWDCVIRGFFNVMVGYYSVRSCNIGSLLGV